MYENLERSEQILEEETKKRLEALEELRASGQEERAERARYPDVYVDQLITLLETMLLALRFYKQLLDEEKEGERK